MNINIFDSIINNIDNKERKQFEQRARPIFIGKDRAELRIVDTKGNFTEYGKEELLNCKSQSKELSTLLGKVRHGTIQSEKVAHINSLVNMGFIDETLNFTENGLCRYIGSLTLKNQVQEIGVHFLEETYKRVPGSTNEEYVERKYKNAGFDATHDEGGRISTLIQFLFMGKREQLTCIANDWAKKIHKERDIGLSTWDFYDTYVNGLPAISDKKRSDILNIISDFSEKDIINGHMLHAYLLEKTGQQPLSEKYQKDRIIDTILAIGRNKALAIIDYKLSPIGGGLWPDITALKTNQINLIEVKKTDKLMAHQIRTIMRLKEKIGTLIDDISVEKVLLI